MRRRGLALAALLAAAPAWAEAPAIAIRTGTHPGFGRVVFDLPPGATYRIGQEDGRVVVSVPAGSFATPGAAPRNVRGIALRGEGVEIAVQPGSRIRPVRLGDRLVIDVLDGGEAAAPPAPPPVKAAAAPHAAA